MIVGTDAWTYDGAASTIAVLFAAALGLDCTLRALRLASKRVIGQHGHGDRGMSSDAISRFIAPVPAGKVVDP
jgi:hypothetical protein